ncbi:MAG TPA: hypothetical protein VFQ85_03655 [Mycobacteriales bacterium]|nr:hypothetical protein [Mycobacteriales bacterium]
MDLTELTYETFRDRVGQAFTDAESGAELTLAEVTDLTETARHVPEDARAPFSLVFTTPQGPVAPQGIRTLGHDELGDLPLFLVPIAQDAEGVRYQAIFS